MSLPALIYYVVLFDSQRSEYLVGEIFGGDELPGRIVDRFDDQADAERLANRCTELEEAAA